MEFKSRKEFKFHTERDLTKEECAYYWNQFPKKVGFHLANEWKYVMGSYGVSTVVKVNEKTWSRRKFDWSRHPSWRPLAKLVGHCRGWDGKVICYEEFYQSWEDLRKAMSDTGDETVELMKHPHQ